MAETPIPGVMTRVASLLDTTLRRFADEDCRHCILAFVAERLTCANTQTAVAEALRGVGARAAQELLAQATAALDAELAAWDAPLPPPTRPRPAATSVHSTSTNDDESGRDEPPSSDTEEPPSRRRRTEQPGDLDASVAATYDRAAGAVGPMRDLCVGLRVPKNAADASPWFQPHSQQRTAKAWERAAKKLLETYGCKFPSVVVAQDHATDVACAVALLTQQQAPHDKEQWRARFVAVGRVLAGVLLCSSMGGSWAADGFRNELRKAFNEGRVDIHQLFVSALNKQAPTQPITVTPAVTVTPPLATPTEPPLTASTMRQIMSQVSSEFGTQRFRQQPFRQYRNRRKGRPGKQHRK